MTVKFSYKNQCFYDLTLNYGDLPDDLVAVTDQQHQELLAALNSSCIVFVNLTYSEPKPSQFHIWDGSSWVDNRTAEEISDYERSLLPVLPKRQFALYLFDHQLYDQVMSALDQNPRFKIEYETVKDLERMSPTVSAMTELLGWTDNQVDEMWRQALEL